MEVRWMRPHLHCCHRWCTNQGCYFHWICPYLDWLQDEIYACTDFNMSELLCDSWGVSENFRAMMGSLKQAAISTKASYLYFLFCLLPVASNHISFRLVPVPVTRRLVPVVNFWPHRQDQPSKNLIIVHWSNRSQRFWLLGMWSSRVSLLCPTIV